MSSDDMRSLYGEAFQAAIAPGSRRSADIVVPLVIDEIGPVRSVIDLGCGTGAWLAAFQAAGATDILGIDGPHVDPHLLRIPPENFLAVDLTEPVVVKRTFDLAISVEVAEHLPSARAESFVADLCGLADTVLFSAAIPHQGGAGHVNERWPSYWVGLFQGLGFGCWDVLRPLLWQDELVELWYRQNLFLFRHGRPDRGGTFPVDVVHPAYWMAPHAEPLRLSEVTRAFPGAARRWLHHQRVVRFRRGQQHG